MCLKERARIRKRLPPVNHVKKTVDVRTRESASVRAFRVNAIHALYGGKCAEGSQDVAFDDRLHEGNA
jgi:hypothetical protein